MRPLVYHCLPAAIVFFATAAGAMAAELALQLRTQSDDSADPSYRWMLIGSTAGSALAFVGASLGPRLPGDRWIAAILGVAVMWLGIALRVWAVRTLGRFFVVEVAVAHDQTVVDTGPYAWVRHPSYTGLLLVYLGLGIALDSWISVAAFLLPTAATVNRIRFEERALFTDLGERYRAYASSRRRLIPGVW